jgi:hypothetical protein
MDFLERFLRLEKKIAKIDRKFCCLQGEDDEPNLFANGLQDIGGNTIGLGGNITENTTIFLDGVNLAISGANLGGEINLTGSDDGSLLSVLGLGSQGAALSVTDGNTKGIVIDMSNDGIQVQDDVDLMGFVNTGDYEANFVPRSLVTKQYVDDAIAAAIAALP